MLKLMLSCNTLPNIDTEVPYPCLASGKLDGIRACIQAGAPRTRTLKDLPNRHTRQRLSSAALEGLDGELTLKGELWNDFNANQSAFMSHDGKPDFIFHVFDDISKPHMPAVKRKALAKERVAVLRDLGYPVEFCEQYEVSNSTDLRAMYLKYRANGYEGLIVMDRLGCYKHGRSTLNQAISLKLKPCKDAEAVVVGFEELQRNLDAGNSKRKENLVPGGTLGRLNVSWDGVLFGIGSGFTDSQRQEIWDNQDKYLGKLVTFKYMEVFKDTGAPRGPIFKGWRSKEDV